MSDGAWVLTRDGAFVGLYDTKSVAEAAAEQIAKPAAAVRWVEGYEHAHGEMGGVEWLVAWHEVKREAWH